MTSKESEAGAIRRMAGWVRPLPGLVDLCLKER